MKYTYLLLFLVVGLIGNTQTNSHKSIHQKQLEYYNSLGHANANYYEQHTTARDVPNNTLRANCNLNKIVYGWHPYWSGNAYQNYDWDLLSHFSFFSYEVNSSTGNPNSTHGWATSSAVDAALASGNTKVTLTVTLFSGHATFFNSSSAQQNLITNLINLVDNRGADGVNIDFEGLPAANKTDFANFMVELSNQMHAAIPNSDVSTVLYAVDWSDVFDFSIMAGPVDHFIIMGYDYYYSGSSNAGPNDPLYHFGNSYNFTLSKSITEYLFKGCPKEKLVLGLPYYGHDWPTATSTVPSSTTANATAKFYNDIKDNNSGNYSASNHQFENDSYTDIYIYNSGGHRQCFITLEDGLRKRLEHINRTDIAGMGIWALGYDDGYTELWDAIEDNMTDCYTNPCSGTITDFGGPRNYYNHEDYTWTIAPDGATSITLEFTSFDVEDNYDYLYIYDGSSTSDPQVAGSPFSGTTLPPTITSSTGALTFRFTSDGATTRPGFEANYSCSVDDISPTTSVSIPSGWKTTDFDAYFTDADETGGSGLAKSFYQVLFYDGTSWGANPNRGFFGDNFDGTTISSNWTENDGNWGISSNNTLKQTDVAEGNSNIYAPLMQNLSNRYLYAWNGKISGNDDNKRAGLHFFCDDATQSNRGNSYLVYFRAGGNPDPNNNNKIQIYKVSNNTLALKKNVSYTITPDEWYNYKIIFDRITGEMWVVVDGDIAATWTDPNPYSDGDFISFRNGNCNYEVDNFKVYRTRYPNVTVTVGPGSNTDVPYQNPDPNTPSAKIKSIVMDSAANLSSIAFEFANVDWTKPQDLYVNDGSGADIDTVYTNTLEGNWGTTNDPHSGIAEYKVAIGTSIGNDDVAGWTSNGTNASLSSTLGGLTYGQVYYITVAAENGAGLIDTTTSDGQIYIENLHVIENELQSIKMYPNPTVDEVQFNNLVHPTAILVYDMAGQLLIETKVNAQNNKIDVSQLSAGSYNVTIKTGNQFVVRKLVKK